MTATSGAALALHARSGPRGARASGSPGARPRRRTPAREPGRRRPRSTRRFTDLGALLSPGDLLVVNTSATIPAALDGRLPTVSRSSCTSRATCPAVSGWSNRGCPSAGSTLPLGLSSAAPRRAAPWRHDRPARALRRVDAVVDRAARPRSGDAPRLPRVRTAARSGTATCPPSGPSRRTRPCSHASPGARRCRARAAPFTLELVTDLVDPRRADRAACCSTPACRRSRAANSPIPSDTGCRGPTAAIVNATAPYRRSGRRGRHHVVRALATVTDDHGVVHPGHGWTDVVVTPDHPVPSVDGLLTGWHEPESSHLLMLEAFAGTCALVRAYEHGARPRLPLARVRRQPSHPARHDGEVPVDDHAPRSRRRTGPARPVGAPVLYAVRRRGEATAEQVAEQLGMTVSGCRQHLSALVRDGLVEATETGDRRAQAGTSDARLRASPPPPTSYFPKAYGELTNELLGYVAESDPALLDDAVREAA